MTAATVASISVSAWSRSRISAEPDCAVGHVPRRAAHVDVDDVGAGGLGDPRALRHPVRLAAGKLHDVRADAGRLAAQPRHRPALREIVARGHLGHDQAGAELRGQPAERRVGDAGHRREQGPGWRRNIADLQWFTAVTLPGRSPSSRCSRRRAIALCRRILQHKFWQSSLHAYTLANSIDPCKCTAAKVCISHSYGNRSVFAHQHGKALCAGQPSLLNSNSTLQVPIEPHDLSVPQPSSSPPGAGFAPAPGGPKQYRTIGGQTVICRAHGAVLPRIRDIGCGAAGESIADDTAIVQRRRRAACAHLPPVHGGATRQASVRAGLEALASAQARHRADPRRRAAVRHRRR